MSYDIEKNIHLKQKRSRKVENVLVLQGGGSLGAFGCGVFKAVVGIKLDIVSGTSIGAINGAIIVGSKSDHPEKALEDFWLELAESSYNIIPDVLMTSYSYRKGAYLKRVPSFLKCFCRDGRLGHGGHGGQNRLMLYIQTLKSMMMRYFLL
jgi:NTE family protein